MSQILASFPEAKKKADGTVSTFLHRPLSWPLTFVFINTGWKPNSVTWLSVGVSLLACAFTFIPMIQLHIAAIGLYLLFGTLDCVDGNMARTLAAKPHPVGEWVDAIGGYAAYTCVLLSMGLSSYYFSPETVPMGQALWLIISTLAIATNLFMRLAFQSWRVASGESSRSSIGGEKRLSEESGITGWLQFLYLAGLLSGYVRYVLCAYALLYIAGCAVSVAKLAVKAERLAR